MKLHPPRDFETRRRVLCRALAGKVAGPLFVALWTIVSLPPARAEADAAPEIVIEKIEAGLEGLYKPGEWTPLWVTVRSSSERTVQVAVSAPDGDDNIATLLSPPMKLQAGAESRLETRFRSGRLSGELQVRLQDASGQTLANSRLRAGDDSVLPAGLRLDVPLWVELGKVDVAAAGSKERRPVSGDESISEARVAQIGSLRELPRDWRALQSVEMLILPTGTAAGGGTPLVSQIEPEIDATIREWVKMGGHLVLSVGADAEAYRASLPAKWVPISVEGELPIRQLPSLEGYSGQHAPLRFTGTLKGARLGKLPLTNVVLRDATSSGPLVASVPYGFGRVTMIAIDIDRAPMSNWKALRAVLEKLGGTTHRSGQVATRKSSRQLTHVGVTDLATQFLQTHEEFPTVRRSSYWTVLGWILVYLGIVGPLDYLLVSRVFRRPELTWISFALLVCAGVAVGAWQAGRNHPHELLVSQFDLVDVDVETKALRRHAWTSLYSPENRRFSVAVEPQDGEFGTSNTGSAADAGLWLGWTAFPENSLGGLYHSAAAFGSRRYQFRATDREVEDLPISRWSTKGLEAAWTGDLAQPIIESTLESAGVGQLKGSLRHRLNGKLEDCLLVVAGWAYLPTEESSQEATLPPNMDWRPTGKTVRQRDLKALLTGEKRRRGSKEDTFSTEILTTTEPYNPLARSRGQQVAMLSFHEVAGGSEYTGLAHEALRGLELSELMRLGRGVLIGRLPSPRSRVVVDGREVKPASESTWVRFLIPIRQSERAPDKTIPKAGDRESDLSLPASKSQ